MSEVEGVGEMVTGAALAMAIEPGAGGDGQTRDGACLNCSAPLTGPYCSACGQKARVHRSLRTFFGDLVQGLFNFEGKIWRTLPLLAWRPGEMTRRYVEGERARFVSPVALYLFTVFAMFAVLNFTGSMGGIMDDGLDRASTAERTELTRLEAERQKVVERQADVAAIDIRIAAKKRDIAELEKVKSGQIVNIDGQDDQDAPQWLKVAAAKIQANPQAFIAKVQDAASKYSWLLIPLSVPFVWLLFPFSRRYHLYDHTVFVTYSIAFMMMLVIAAGLLVSAGMTSLASLLFFVPPIHMYRQLRGAYGLNRFSALLRTFFLVTFACVVAMLFLMAVFAIGAL